jgi:hypothetical protein
MTQWRDEKWILKFSNKMNGTEHLGDQEVNTRIILKQLLKKQDINGLDWYCNAQKRTSRSLF